MSNMTSKQFLENLAVVRAEMADHLPVSAAIDQLLVEKKITSENLTQKDVEDIQRFLANGFYNPVNKQSTAARVLLNIVPILFTGPLFHLMYWAVNSIVVLIKNAKESSLSSALSRINPLGEDKPEETAKFRWDWTKSFPHIGHMFTSMKLTKALIDAQVETPVVEAERAKVIDLSKVKITDSMEKEMDQLLPVIDGLIEENTELLVVSDSEEEDGERSFAEGQQMWTTDRHFNRDVLKRDIVLNSQGKVETNTFL